MSKPYYDLESNFGYIGRYKIGLTGETGVLITPLRKTQIEQRVDAYIEGRLGQQFLSSTPPVIQMIAEFLSFSEVIMVASPGRDPSNQEDRMAAAGYKFDADQMLDQILNGRLALYQTDGTQVSAGTGTATVVEVGSEEETVFELGSDPHTWPNRTDVYEVPD